MVQYKKVTGFGLQVIRSSPARFK